MHEKLLLSHVRHATGEVACLADEGGSAVMPVSRLFKRHQFLLLGGSGMVGFLGGVNLGIKRVSRHFGETGGLPYNMSW